MRLDFFQPFAHAAIRPKRSAWPRAAATLAFAAVALGAGAQSPPGGIAVGSFKVDPRLDVERSFTSNVQRAPRGALSDQLTRVMPGVSARSTWTRHELNASLDITDETHHRLKGESADTYALRLDGRIDAGAALAFPLALERERVATKRGHPNEAGGRDRHTDTIERLRAGLSWKSVPWRLDLGTQFQDTDAKDVLDLAGRTINRDDEDRTQRDHSAKLGYQVSQAWSVFGKAVRTRVDYRDPFDDRLVDRDSIGGALSAGTMVALGPSKLFKLEAGRERRRFNGALGTFSDSTLNVFGMWGLAPSLVGTATHSRMFQETVLPGSPGMSVRATMLSLGWTIDPRWRADLSFTRNEMAPERLPERFRPQTVSLATRYSVNRYVQLRLNAARNTQPADGVLVPGYRENVVTAGLTLVY